jgi:hypothetical protein
MRLAPFVNLVLLAAFAIDVGLTMGVIVSPGAWFGTLHGTGYDAMDLAFLRRCAAEWAVFAILQGVTLVLWRYFPGMLLVVAGARFADVLTDWTYLASSETVTVWAWPGLIAPGLMNLGMGILLLLGHAEAVKADAD